MCARLTNGQKRADTLIYGNNWKLKLKHFVCVIIIFRFQIVKFFCELHSAARFDQCRFARCYLQKQKKKTFIGNSLSSQAQQNELISTLWWFLSSEGTAAEQNVPIFGLTHLMCHCDKSSQGNLLRRFFYQFTYIMALGCSSVKSDFEHRVLPSDGKFGEIVSKNSVQIGKRVDKNAIAFARFHIVRMPCTRNDYCVICWLCWVPPNRREPDRLANRT